MKYKMTIDFEQNEKAGDMWALRELIHDLFRKNVDVIIQNIKIEEQ